MKGLAVLVGGVGAVPVCDTYWDKTFKPDGNHIFAVKDGESDGAVGTTGVYKTSANACRACVEALVNTKSCADITAKKCFASSLAVDFEEKHVEKIEDKAADEKTKMEQLKGSTSTEWTYVTGGGDGAVPEGAEACGQVLYRAENGIDEYVHDPNVDAACADTSKPYCGALTPFEECCMGTRPQNSLCIDGKGCQGEENTTDPAGNAEGH